jgi:hypothetical protein
MMLVCSGCAKSPGVIPALLIFSHILYCIAKDPMDVISPANSKYTPFDGSCTSLRDIKAYLCYAETIITIDDGLVSRAYPGTSENI